MSKLVCGILAHVDAGKTTLSEAMLYTAGARRQLGRVDHGNAFLDTHTLEHQRGITIFSKLALLHTNSRELTLVDTPGHVDFCAEAERTLPILDCAILVINGADGLQAHTLTLWDLLRRYDIPTFLFVNKTDLAGTDSRKVLRQLQNQLSEQIVDFTSDFQAVQEACAMCSEEALDKFLEKGTLDRKDIQVLISGRRLFPCCFGSALKLDGISEFLNILDCYAPEYIYPDSFSAKIYKISRDDQGNRLTWMKITGGQLTIRTSLSYSDCNGTPYNEKCTGLRLYSGAQFSGAEAVTAGSCCAVLGLSATYAGQTIGCTDAPVRPVLEPVMTYRLCLPKACDPLTILPKLRQLEEEEPQLHIFMNQQSRQIHVQIMGKVQLEILQSLITQRFDVPVSFDSGTITYLETIQNAVEGIGHFEPLRHYAEVHLLLQPGPPGSGITVSSVCAPDVLDVNYQNLVLTHILEKKHLGVLTGSPVTDLKITLVSGRAHLKHTEGGDFRQATYRAIRQGLMQAQSVLLEPWYEFTLSLPTEQIGRAITDIRSMSGEFDTPESCSNISILHGKLPISEAQNYAADVAAYTHGVGIFHTRVLGYLPCHNAESVIAEIGYQPETDPENTPDSVFCMHGAGFNVKWNHVTEYMHLSSIMEKPAAPQIVTRNLRIDDKELEQIMEREFGPIRRKQYTAPKNTPATDQFPIAPPKQKILLIDGYNLLFASEELSQMSKIDLASARRRLIELLDNYSGFKHLELILVFDGYRAKGNPGEKDSHNRIQIIYTREGQTADAYIESFAAQIGNNYNIRVVTSDALVQLSSFRSGLLRMSAREFWDDYLRSEAEMQKFMVEFRQKENRNFAHRPTEFS